MYKPDWNFPQIDPELLKTARQDYIRRLSFSLEPKELAFVDDAKADIGPVYRHGWYQLIARGLDSQGGVHVGTHSDCPNGDDTHAEIDLHHEILKLRAELMLMVVVHQKRPDEGGEVHVTGSCGRCIEVLAHHYPKMWTIIYSAGQLRKIPMEALRVHPYKWRVPNGNGNGVSGHQFPH